MAEVDRDFVQLAGGLANSQLEMESLRASLGKRGIEAGYIGGDYRFFTNEVANEAAETEVETEVVRVLAVEDEAYQREILTVLFDMR